MRRSAWVSAGSLRDHLHGLFYPSPDIDAIHENAFKGTATHKWAPYGLIAFEFAEDEPGTYLELGVGPTFRSDAKQACPR